MLPPPRRRRAWNTFDRWYRLHTLTRTIMRKIATACVYGVVRNIDRASPRQHMQLTNGGRTGGGDDYTDIFDDCFALEQHGFTSGLQLGARGAVFKPGGTEEYTAAVGVSKYTQRPTWLESGEVCVWSEFNSRMMLEADGQLRIETDLADYKDGRQDVDEGAKIRLKAGAVVGGLELYGEDFVSVRAQPQAGAAPVSAVTVTAGGTVVLESEEDGSEFARVTLSSDGTITIANANSGNTASVEISSSGNITVIPSAGGEVRLGDSVGLQAVALAELVKDQLDALAEAFNTHIHVETGVNTNAPTVVPGVIPVLINDVASSNVKAKI